MWYIDNKKNYYGLETPVKGKNIYIEYKNLG